MENKRYQIFISSTYTDLKEERAEVTQAILSINHMPYGMEVFPSANETQWEYIKRVIKESDYYIVIISGKYGSVNSKTGISYTEMEYRYAEELGIPLLAFIIDDNIDLPNSKVEADSDKKQKLDNFKRYIESKQMRKSYKNKEDLALKVITSLTQLFQQCPRDGWIRTASLKSYTSNDEVIRLMKENDSLKKEINSIELLKQGDDIHTVKYYWAEMSAYGRYISSLSEESTVDLKWNTIFLCVAAYLFNGSRTTGELRAGLEDYIKRINGIPEEFSDVKYVKVRVLKQMPSLLLQLEALGYITSASNDKWKLLSKGRKLFTMEKSLKK